MMEELQKAYLEHVDVEYAYHIARALMKFRSNPVLGYRNAGSRAELEAGDFLAGEMERIGLKKVKKEKLPVDSWEFKKAVLSYQGEDGSVCQMQLGAYPTTFVTNGPEEFSLVYLGKGTVWDYQGRDVRGKLVLVEVNQRTDWWINYPVYQAHLKGAKALIAMQTGGHGEESEDTLNAQDITGPSEAAAFSISRRDGELLKKALEEKGEITVTLDADSQVKRDQYSYNILGKIPGRNKERMLLLSAHYDAYFEGFQDDGAAVGMMLSIGKALTEMDYKPENTILFCAMAAEEWGVEDSPYDWSTGAYEQVFHLHPEWKGKVIGALNFELPAIGHGERDYIRSGYEYTSFLREFLGTLPLSTKAYSQGVGVKSPVEPWSDDFSMNLSGIPAMVNDFFTGDFMKSHYHSQLDNGEAYEEEVYRFHHELYGLLLLALDWTAVVPLDFSGLFRALEESVNLDTCRETRAWGRTLCGSLEDAADMAGELYEKVRDINEEYARLLAEGKRKKAEKLLSRSHSIEAMLLELFAMEQDAFVRLNWRNEVHFPQEVVEHTLLYVSKAAKALEHGEIGLALEALSKVDNNGYALFFDEEVYVHFTVNVIRQLPERLKWGAGRVKYHENLYRLMHRLKEKEGQEAPDVTEERRQLESMAARQRAYYQKEIEGLIKVTGKMKKQMLSCEHRKRSF